MANEEEPSHPMGLSPEHVHEMRTDNAIIALQDPIRKLMEHECVKGSEGEPLAIRSLMSTPLTLPSHHLIKIMKIGVLEEEGIIEMTIVSSILRQPTLMTISNPRITLIGYKPLKGSLNLESTMMKTLSSLLSSR